MDRIFEKAADLHVRGTFVYGNGSDTYAYADAACKVKLTTAQLTELFLKGAVIKIGTAMYKPAGLTAKNDIASIAYIKADTSTPTTAVCGVLTSVKE